MELNAQLYMTSLNAATASMVATITQMPPTNGVEDGIPPDGVVPADILRALADMRLLEGVPFSYLVPDADLLPTESIRFFYVDRNATDALVQGALSVGAANSVDRVELAQLYQVIRDEVDEAERLVRLNASDAPTLDATGRPIGIAGPITGFVMRSQLVSGWPAMHVRAYSTDTRPDDQTAPDMDTSPDRVRLLRMERLAPAVLLVLFDGVPAVVHIEEPRSGIQFGVRLAVDADPAQQTAVVTPRDVTNPNNGPLQSGGADVTVAVPFRRGGAAGVINMRALNQSLIGTAGTNMGDSVDAAEYAIQMLRFPLRQVFGKLSGPTTQDAFQPTLSIPALANRFAAISAVLETRETP